VMVAEVRRAHKQYEDIYNAALTYPLCKHGSVVDVIKRIAGRKVDYWFEDSLLLRNIKGLIFSLAILESKEIFHGNIHPANIYVSDDGFNLMLGDFLPRSEMRRWLSAVSKQLANPPKYSSPELYDVVYIEKVKSFTSIQKKINLHKNDVFSLGMVMYYLATRSEPEDFKTEERILKKGVKRFSADTTRDAELSSLILRMLLWDSQARPTFWELLSLSQRAALKKEAVVGGILNKLGFQAPKLEPNIVTVNKLRRGEKPSSNEEENNPACSIS